MYPSGSTPACIYGIPKMHKFSSSKSFPKLCPIFSSVDTSNYNLAPFVCDLLSLSVPNDYSCKDTFYFVSQIKHANYPKKFVSYDVTSLSTNIPLQETIDIAINLIFATSQTHFIFNSKFYKQIDVVTMGCPLAPALANIFIDFYESNWV